MKSRWLIVILLISAALNLLFIGAMVGRFATPSTIHPFPPHLGWIVRHLDPESHQSLREDLRMFAEQDRGLRRGLMNSQRSVNDLFLADPIDRPALEKQLTKLRAASMESQHALHQSMVEIMLQLDVDERRRVLGALQRNWREEFRQHRGRPRPGDERPGKR